MHNGSGFFLANIDCAALYYHYMPELKETLLEYKLPLFNFPQNKTEFNRLY